MAQKCSDTSTTAANEDGLEAEGSYALPLTGGESYPLDITPTPPPQVYKEYTPNWQVKNSVDTTTPRHPYYDMYDGVD